MKNFAYITCVVLLALLTGCKVADSPSASSYSSSSSSSSSSGITLEGKDILAEFSSLVEGNYELFSNTDVESLASTYPIQAALPKIIQLEKSDELQGFIEQSKSLGFDKDQFDILYRASFEVLDALRLRFFNDLSGGELGLAWGNFNFASSIVHGSQGKGKTFTLSLNQLHPLSDCELGEDVCTIKVEALVVISFPISNPTFGLNVVSKTVVLQDMKVNIPTFKLSNQRASLDVSLSPKNTFILNIGHEFIENTAGDIGHLSLWTEGLSEQADSIESNLMGVFTNQAIDGNGVSREVKVTGAMTGTAQGFNFEQFYDAPKRVISTELEPGQVTGSMSGANLKIHFITEVLEL